MIVKDKTEKGTIGGREVPKLHGHTKITLTDVRTGKKEIIEKDNLVTDEVANIYANNLFGAMDYSKVMPLRDMFGGVLVFDDTQDTSLLYPPDDDTIGLVANCGMDSHTSASPTRGNFNGALSEMISSDTGYRFVFDFPTNVGNGTWKSISLCNRYGGSVGTKPIEAITGGSLIGLCSNKTKKLLEGKNIPYDTYYYALVKVNLTTGTGIQAVLDGSTLTLNEVSLCTSKVGINNTCDRTVDESVDEAVVTNTHSITLSRSYDKQYAAICCAGGLLYVVEPNSNTGSSLYVDIVDLSDWSVTTTTITDANMSLSKVQNRARYTGYAVRTCISNGYIYWAKSDRRTFYKINLSNPADISECTSTLTADIDEDFGLVEFGTGFVVGANYFINGDTVYPMTKEETDSFFVKISYGDYAIVRIIKDATTGKFYAWAYCDEDLYNFTIYAFIAYPRLYLGTIQNLNSAVVKDNTHTAQIEYSITLS